MRRVSHAGILLVFLLAFSNRVYPQGGFMPEATQLLIAAVVPEDKFDPSSRMKFAQALSAYCDAMVSATPTNTPDEHKWLMQETDPSSPVRYSRAVASAEWARDKLMHVFVSCQSSIHDLEQAQITNDRNREALVWLSLAQIFNGDQSLNDYCKRASMDPEVTSLLPNVTPAWREAMLKSAQWAVREFK